MPSMKWNSLIPTVFLAASIGAAAVQVTTSSATSGRQSAGIPLYGLATPWELIYEHDASGVPISGSLAELVAAVQAGADVKRGSYPPTASGSAFYHLHQVEVTNIGGTLHVGGQYEGLSLIDAIGPPSIRSDPYRAFTWVDTSGGTALQRRSFGNNANLGDTVTVHPGAWFVRR
ncbi:MAG: hypothetical protein ACI8QZ_003083 [Chlamydiales bacterium]|jgi:hypothetical protein